METDKRRYRVVTVRRINAETYWLEIDGVMWSEVEWSPSRRAWCIQDAAGACLAHVESIQGQTPDVQEAIRLAKRMIVDGRMPGPEEAHERLQERQRRAKLGEPLTAPLIKDDEGGKIPAPNEVTEIVTKSLI